MDKYPDLRFKGLTLMLYQSNNGEILPINLSVYDTDGIQGMYVRQSEFREMMRQMGTNSVQGTQMDMSSQNFFTSITS
jgi:hypothetical protein